MSNDNFKALEADYWEAKLEARIRILGMAAAMPDIEERIADAWAAGGLYTLENQFLRAVACVVATAREQAHRAKIVESC